MTTLAPLLQAFFTERLQSQRQASSHTIRAYKLTFSLLLRFARDRLGSISTVQACANTEPQRGCWV
jgi:integrase/recombinase XerD